MDDAAVFRAGTSGVPPVRSVESVRTNWAISALSQMSPSTGTRGLRRSMAMAPRSERVHTKTKAAATAAATMIAKKVVPERQSNGQQKRGNGGQRNAEFVVELSELWHGVGDHVSDQQERHRHQHGRVDQSGH